MKNSIQRTTFFLSIRQYIRDILQNTCLTHQKKRKTLLPTFYFQNIDRYCIGNIPLRIVGSLDLTKGAAILGRSNNAPAGPIMDKARHHSFAGFQEEEPEFRFL